MLLAFFLPSIALSRIGRARKKQLVDIDKGGARDIVQVLANGGIATLCAVGTGVFLKHAQAGSPATVWLVAFAGAYAAATADTWGTEIGTLAKHLPYSIVTFRPLATGLSGGITFPGTLAEAAGALWIAVVAVSAIRLIPNASTVFPLEPLRAVAAIASGGMFGAVIDSLLGATVQELRSCSSCGRTCETNPHVCGHATERVRGIPGFTNDAVNALATAGGAAIAMLVAIA